MSRTSGARAGGTPVFTRTSTAAACLSFALIGGLASFYGPLIPVLEAKYGIGPSLAGGVLSAHFGGSVVGVLAAARALRSVAHGRFLVLSLLTLALGCLFFAVAPTWPAVLAAAVVIGGGFGALDLGVNQLFTHELGGRRTSMINVLNAFFGIGAVAGPVVVAAVPATAIGWVFAACAGLALALSLLLRHVRGEGRPDPPASYGEGGVTPLVIALLVGAYVLYVGVEAGVSGWEPSHLLALGAADAVARSSTSAFWLCLTAGRFLVAPLVHRLGAQRIVLACSVAGVLALSLALVPGIAPLAYAATGLVIAPIYPTGLAWLAWIAPGARRWTTVLVAAAMVGGAVFPTLTGFVIQGAGVQATPAVLAALAAGCAVSFGLVSVLVGRGGRTPRRWARPATPPVAGSMPPVLAAPLDAPMGDPAAPPARGDRE